MTGFLLQDLDKKFLDLYIDPMTARDFRNAMVNMTLCKGGEHTFGILHLITTCDEFYSHLIFDIKILKKHVFNNENNRHTLIRIIQEEDCSRSFLL